MDIYRIEVILVNFIDMGITLLNVFAFFALKALSLLPGGSIF